MSKIFETKKGTKLPLMNLKGKDYMMVAYRIQWFTEEVPKFNISTEFIKLTDDETVVKARVQVFDENGVLVRHAEGTKRETRKDFPDHTEKAETAAIGRALIQLGYGTQFALADMEEGMRLADSPLQAVDVKPTSNNLDNKSNSVTISVNQADNAATPVPSKTSRFTPKNKQAETPKETAGSEDGWN